MREEQMKAFIRDLFDEFYPDCGDIDGGTLQDLAEKHGILVSEIHHEPCGEFCNCAELCSDEEFQEGVKCYRLANWLSAQQMPKPPVTDVCHECGESETIDPNNDGVPVCVFCGTRR